MPLRKPLAEMAQIGLEPADHNRIEIPRPDRHAAGEPLRVEKFSSSVENGLEYRMCGVAERNNRCSNLPAKSRTDRVNWLSIA